MEKIKRTFEHKVLSETFETYPNSTLKKGLFTDLFLYKFPLAICTELSNFSDNFFQVCVELSIISRLRAKGYKVTVISPETEKINKFFLSLGETNIEIKGDKTNIDIDKYDIFISCEFNSLSNRKLSINFPRIPNNYQQNEEWVKYIDSQIIVAFCDLTFFDRYFTPRKINYNSTNLNDFNFNVDSLVEEFNNRFNYSFSRPFMSVNVDSADIKDLSYHKKAIKIWNSLIKNDIIGLSINEIVALMNDDITSTLISLRRLLKANVICNDKDRFYAISSNGGDINIQENQKEINISVLFPEYVFGYDINDGDKCSAVRMIEAGYAQIITELPEGIIVLDPTSEIPLSENDLPAIHQHGICIVDIPWYLSSLVSIKLEKKYPSFTSRCLNMPKQTNSYYNGSTKISSAGATAYVTAFAGSWQQTEKILGLFDWGEEWFTELKSLFDNEDKKNDR